MKESFYNSSKSNNTALDLIETFKQNYPVELWERYGLFKDDFILKINAHWLEFSPPSANTHYCLAGLYLIIMTLGMFGNALVVYLINRCKSLKTPGNLLIMNLAISDFLIMSEMPIFIFNSIHRGPALGEQVCRYYGFIGGLSGTVSICTLAAISFDRYYVIKFPLNMRFTRFRAKLCVVITWIYGVVFSAIPLLDVGLGSYVPEGYLTSCSYDYLTDNYNARLFIFVFFIAAWLIPFILISYCYVAIMEVVMAQKKLKTKSAESSKHVKQEEKKKQEVKLALLVFFVIALWFAAWTPYSIVSLLGICGRKDLIQPFYSMIPALFCKTASCADPFVYALIHPRFKAEIIKLFSKSNGRISRKVWSSETQATRWRNRLSRRQTVDSTYLDDDEPEIEMITIENVTSQATKQICKEFHERRNESGDESEMKDKNFRKPPWWYRPSFNDRFSSIRYLQRSLSKSSQKEQQDDDDHVSI